MRGKAPPGSGVPARREAGTLNRLGDLVPQ